MMIATLFTASQKIACCLSFFCISYSGCIIQAIHNFIQIDYAYFDVKYISIISGDSEPTNIRAGIYRSLKVLRKWRKEETGEEDPVERSDAECGVGLFWMR